MRGGANCHFTGPQVHIPPFSDIAERPLHQPIYFLRRLGENCSAIFSQSLQLLRILDLGRGTQPTNLFIDPNQFLPKTKENLVILQFPLSLFQFRPQAQILRPALAAAGGVPEVLGAVSGMSELGAGAPFLAAPTEVHRDGARAKVSKGLHLLIQTGSSLLQLLKGLSHGASLSLNAL